MAPTAKCEKQQSSFTCFPKLPPDIRNAIWRLAEPNRILIIKHTWRGVISLSDTHDPFSIRQPQRPLSHVNKEARRETSLDYIHLKSADYDGILKNDVHFNPRRDTIAFTATSFSPNSWRLFLRIFSNGDGQHSLPIKRLAFDVKTFQSHGVWVSILPLLNFPGLEELFLVMGPSDVTRTGLASELELGVFTFSRAPLDRVTNALDSQQTGDMKGPVVKWMTICDEDGAYYE